MKIRTLIATAAIALCAVPSFAVPTTFAQFQQASSGNQFTFTNNSTSPTNLELTASLPVNFEFLVPNLYGAANTPIAATLTLTGTANPAATTSGANVFQEFSTVTMTFTADTPVDGHSNLLTLESSSNGELDAKKNASSASLNGDTGSGSVVDFSSDFVFFNLTTERAYDLSFTSLSVPFTLATTTTGHQTVGFPKTFTAAGTGTFASDPAPNIGVPEPSPAIALLLGGAGLALLFARTRKTAFRPMNA